MLAAHTPFLPLLAFSKFSFLFGAPRFVTSLLFLLYSQKQQVDELQSWKLLFQSRAPRVVLTQIHFIKSMTFKCNIGHI